jgi:ABC-type transport system involved in multi-copper enzyme maturation permease subunit
VVLLVALFLAGGLYQARSLFRRELAAYFYSPIAYVIMATFLVLTGVCFVRTLNLLTASDHVGTEYPMQAMFGQWWFWLVFLLLPPALTMRLFAEESTMGTLEMLLTSPLKEWQIVVTKFFACFTFYLLMWAPTLLYLPILLNMENPHFQVVVTPWTIVLVAGILSILLALFMGWLHLNPSGRIVSLLLLVGGVAATVVGARLHALRDAEKVFKVTMGIDPGPVLSTYLGLILVGAMFLGLGLLVSSLVRSQLVAVLISAALGLVFILGGVLVLAIDTSPGRVASTGDIYQVLSAFSVPLHFAHDFTRGVVDVRHLVLYVSVAAFCVYLTVHSLESRRWR